MKFLEKIFGKPKKHEEYMVSDRIYEDHSTQIYKCLNCDDYYLEVSDSFYEGTKHGKWKPRKNLSIV